MKELLISAEVQRLCDWLTDLTGSRLSYACQSHVTTDWLAATCIDPRCLGGPPARLPQCYFVSMSLGV